MAAPAVALAAKVAGKWAVQNWKKAIPILFAVLLLVAYFPMMLMYSFLPSAQDGMKNQYENVAKDSDLDWIEMIAYDTVLSDNNFENVHPAEAPLNLLKIDYEIYEERMITTTKYKTVIENGVKKTISYEEEETSWELVESNVVSGYSQIATFLAKTGYNIIQNNMTIPKIKNYCDQLNSSEKYEILTTKISVLDLVMRMNETQKAWYFDLVSALYDQNHDNTIKDYINPDGSYMSNIKISDIAYPLGDTSILTGDVDINKVFAGRLAALAKDMNKDNINITSGYRSIQEQQAIWDSTPPERRGTYVARPGTSRHQYGIAADVSGWLIYLTNDVLMKYGLYKPMSYENWHIEPIETKQ